jgi:hypothetical protein
MSLKGTLLALTFKHFNKSFNRSSVMEPRGIVTSKKVSNFLCPVMCQNLFVGRFATASPANIAIWIKLYETRNGWKREQCASGRYPHGRRGFGSVRPSRIARDPGVAPRRRDAPFIPHLVSAPKTTGAIRAALWAVAQPPGSLLDDGRPRLSW